MQTGFIGGRAGLNGLHVHAPLHGQAIGFGDLRRNGLPLNAQERAIDVELPRGAPRTIVLEMNEPAGTGDPIVLRQPLVRPLQVTLKDAVCG